MPKFNSDLLPQANSLQRILQTVDAVAAGYDTFQGIASYFNADDRQGRYYRRAAETMGLLSNVGNHSVLSASGQEMAQAASGDRTPHLREAVQKNQVIAAFTGWLASLQNGATPSDIDNWIADNTTSTGATIPRRRSTIRAWLVGTGLAIEVQSVLRPTVTLLAELAGGASLPEIEELPPGPRSRVRRMRQATPIEDFDPANLDDGRTRTQHHIWQRQGQGKFRRQVVDAYGGKCAVTGFDVLNGLDAAHIVPFRGPDTNHPQNGLLLRADIHNLFDLGLLAIDAEQLCVVLAPALEGSAYEQYQGQRIHLPTDPGLKPSREALRAHREAAGI